MQDTRFSMSINSTSLLVLKALTFTVSKTFVNLILLSMGDRTSFL